MPGFIEISVGEVNEVEAHVDARFVLPDGNSLAKDEGVVVLGTIRGPFCEGSRTLPAAFVFRNLAPPQAGQAEAVIPDPCLWSEELPHVYQVDVEARRGETLLAAYHGQLGLRRSQPRQRDILFPKQVHHEQ
jgi:hypothetical protein